MSQQKLLAEQRRGSLLPPVGRRSRHGLSPDALGGLLARQRGLCPVCGDPLGATYSIDHDHALARTHPHGEMTGCGSCVRGALHLECNSVVGFARDRPETLEGAARYLRAWYNLKRHESHT